MFPDLPFNWLDYLMLTILGISTLVSLLRGFVREALSLASWGAGFLVAMTFAGQLSGRLAEFIDDESLRYAAAYVILFLVTLMLGGLLNRLLFQLIQMTGLGGLDRLLGMVFGFARGLLLAMAVVYVGRALVPEDDQDAIRESRVLPHLLVVVDWAEGHLAGLLADRELPWRT